jgi:hypothetical protein
MAGKQQHRNSVFFAIHAKMLNAGELVRNLGQSVVGDE